MIKMRFVTAVLAATFGFASVNGALAQQTPKPAPAKTNTDKPKPKPAAAKPAQAKPVAGAPAGGTAPVLLGQFGEWKAYVSRSPKSQICYALAQPKERKPPTLKRDPGFLFISLRPADGIRNEVSAMVGFPTKEGGEAAAQIGTVAFDMATKDDNVWIRNPAEESRLIDSMRRGKDLVLKVTSLRGNESTDRYSLGGLAQALDRVAQECK